MKDLTKTSTPVLPHQSDVTFLIDGGCETTLIFEDKLDLPYFASFALLETPEGTAVLRRYFRRHLEIAQARGLGFVLETPTWRASADWGALLGYDAARLREVNRRAVDLMQEIRAEAAPSTAPIIVSGCIGPRGDGYVSGAEMTPEEAEAYHRPQIEALSAAGAEMATALTMTYASEAIGIARAAQAVGLPIVVSFTTETDGRLPNGQPLAAAIAATDAATGQGPIYYMVNCAHPDHFADVLEGDWLHRIGGFRANASRLSHAELDEAEELDAGDPVEFGELHKRLIEVLPSVHVLGGCCGTDHRHIGAVAMSIS
ncbi:MAG: homocysteine S-methyltransferase family protein [Silicimonas sp.]|jgi:homocysteine S-methyltransferase|nr:homocysteine S-methyltransferase family protein [Silicimonas sp.]